LIAEFVGFLISAVFLITVILSFFDEWKTQQKTFWKTILPSVASMAIVSLLVKWSLFH
jgi:membrane protein DedA with SNARE-associated domain